MSEDSIPKAPTSYYVVGGIGLLWNALGVLAYLMQVTATPEALAAAYSQEQVELLLAVPEWATSSTAIATNFGFLGCLLLLLRNNLAKLAFVISFVGIVVQDVYLFGLSDSVANFGNFPLIMQSIVFVVAIVLIWYSRSVADRYYR